VERYISVIVPNHNGGKTIGKCLEAAFSSRYKNFEVVVVDDCSDDNSIEIINKFPCKLIRLDKHSGASRARNKGAINSSGEVLFFIDSDCLLQKNTLAVVNDTFTRYCSSNTLIGGTYTWLPYDNNFFSIFQSIFVRYSETKRDKPDYIAAHAMIIDSGLFRSSGGFSEDFLPIIEDVEFSHRLQKSGYNLVMNPDIQVQHIFNFTLMKSLKNAFRKSMFWTIYSMKNSDLFKDSGTASAELKINVAAYFLILLLAALSFTFKNASLLIPLPFAFIFNLFINRKFLKSLCEVKGLSFAIRAALYYTMLYPLAVGAGAFAGMVRYLWSFLLQRGH